MKQLINKILNIGLEEEEPKEVVMTDKVLTEGQLEGMRQIYIFQREEDDDEDVESDKEMAIWTTRVKKGGD